MGKECSAQDLG